MKDYGLMIWKISLRYKPLQSPSEIDIEGWNFQEHLRPTKKSMGLKCSWRFAPKLLDYTSNRFKKKKKKSPITLESF